MAIWTQRGKYKSKFFPPVSCLTLSQELIFRLLGGGRTRLGMKRMVPPHKLCYVEGWAGRCTPRGRTARSLGQTDPRDVPEREKVLKGQGVADPTPARAPSIPDGVCLRHTHYHTRKPRVITSVPNTTPGSRDMSIVSWSWVLRRAYVARGKTSYFKSWLQGELAVQGQRLLTQAAQGEALDPRRDHLHQMRAPRVPVRWPEAPSPTPNTQAPPLGMF